MSSRARHGSVGTSPAHPDGAAKVTGRARYVDDLDHAGGWFGATVRSTSPAGRIVAVEPACSDPQAVVLTAADLPGPNVLRLIADDWPILADGEVRHVGEPVALVAAPTRARARAAAAEVRVLTEERPAVLTLDEALDGGSRCLAECAVDHGDVERGLRDAQRVVEGTYETGHQEHAYIEPQGMIAIPHGDGTVEIVGSMQCPYYVHKALEHVFGAGAVRVRQAPTGGAFGGKEDFPDMVAAHAALLARHVGHPVKIVYERHEDIVATTKRHPARVRHVTGLTSEGRLVAMEIDVLMDGGAYTTLSPVVLSRAVLHAGGAYACPNVRIRGRVLATNTATNGAFRGFGAPQTQFAVERHMDRIARELDLDPLGVRELNAYREGDVTPTGQVLGESVSALECLRVAEERTGFRARWREQERRRKEGPSPEASAAGIGLSLCWHGAGFTGNGERVMRSPAMLRLERDGRVGVHVSSTDFGQGTSIVLAQIVADAVGVDLEQVRVVEADTAHVPDSGPTVASRTVMIVGGVLERAGRRLARELAAFVAEAAGVGEALLEAGGFVDPDGARLASFAEAAARHADERGPLEVVERHEPDPGQDFDEATYRGTAYAAYGWGVNVIELDLDTDTLAAHPRRATLVFDVGKAIHPVACAGQIEGGALQALGLAHLEEMKLEGGRYLNDTLSTYVIPTALDTPDLDTVLIENPAPGGPQGAKGIGELPMDGLAPALLQAIENASGIVPTRAPATPEVLLADLMAGKTARDALELTRAEREGAA